MARHLLAASTLALVACSSHAPATAPVAPPPASTACYAGYSTGMGQRARTIARRTVDPAAHQILEDVSHDDAGAHGAKSFHVVMAVDGDRFTMTERGGAFTGTGTLVGPAWQWTAWTSTSQIPHTTITVASSDELTATGMRATKQIMQDGKLLGTTTDELQTFDCAEWDKVLAQLAVPVLDDTTCDRACRNFASLKFWASAELEVAVLPPADQPAARARKQAELTAKLDAGVGACKQQCLTAGNAAQTACIGAAKTVEDLAACDAIE